MSRKGFCRRLCRWAEIAATTTLVSTAKAQISQNSWTWSALFKAEETCTNRPMRGFLWVPDHCQTLRAVVIGNNNMLEQGIMQDPRFRKSLADLGFGEIYFSNIFDAWFDPKLEAIPKFNRMMARLAEVSGYQELNTVPVVPIGHSACASYPWNFGAFLPQRTLCMLSIHGDSPRTNLPGSGRPNFDWGNRNIDGIPGLLDMGEYEWWEARLDPTVSFKRNNPKAVISLRCDAGNGHFNTSRALIDYLCLFLRKAAAARLSPPGTPLKPVDPTHFWLEDRWRQDLPPRFPAAPYADFKGDRSSAYFSFDSQTARANEQDYARQRAKKSQLVGFLEGAKFVPQTQTHEQLHLKFSPEADGVTFNLEAGFYPTVPGGSDRLPTWAKLPVGASIGHAQGPIDIEPITAPVQKLGPNRFRLRLDRINADIIGGFDLWFAAIQPGDSRYKSAVQQAEMHISPNTMGQSQTIAFSELPDVHEGAHPIPLRATSSAGLPVSFYVLEGPAQIRGHFLEMTGIPPRAKFPVKVTVVAWQWGTPVGAGVQTAAPVSQSFWINR